METLMLLLLFPLAWPFVARVVWHTTISWGEVGANIGLVVAVVLCIWFTGVGMKTADFEVWNGEVLSKSRDHGHYIESYSCNCRSVSCGKNCSTTVCQTCFRDHYTVTWLAKTSVGAVTFEHLDRLSRSVYNSPDPTAYTKCAIGEPAALEKSFTNYIKAVPESLFNQGAAAEHKTPAYPRVHNFYRINRVVNEGAVKPEIARDLNDRLNHALKKLGGKKQVNVVVILTKNADPNYKYAVEKAWIGGKKNDVVAFIALDGDRILWADAFTFAKNSGNELFHVLLRDGLRKIGTFDQAAVTNLITSTISQKYDRPRMQDFEYLKDSITPPDWLLILSAILAVFGSLGLTVLFHREAII